MTLRAAFVPDESQNRKGFTGARCELPNGQVVEARGRRTPLYDLARKLDEQGFGDWKLQAYTPAGTKSLRGKVSVMAGLTVSERDKEGLRLEKYRPFPSRGRVTQRDLGLEGTPTPREGENAPVREPSRVDAA